MSGLCRNHIDNTPRPGSLEILLVCLLSQCNFYVSCRWRQTAHSMLYYDVHTKDTARGEGRMIVKSYLRMPSVLPLTGWRGDREELFQLSSALCCLQYHQQALLVREKWQVASCSFSSHGVKEPFLRFSCLKPDNTHAWGNCKRLFQSKGH